MSDTAQTLADDSRGPELELRMSARLRALAQRLAALIDPFDAPEIQGQVGFLRAMGDTTNEPADPRGAQIFGRLADAWALDDLDLDLLTLAAMPDAHEGYASVFASLHPRAEPRPSVGLAAQLLGPSPDQRASLRRRLEVGALARNAVLVIADDGPFFNRSVTLGPGVGALLHGGSRWPSGVAVELDHGAQLDRAGFDRWLQRPACQRAVAAVHERVAVDIVVLAEDPYIARDRALVLVAAAGREAITVELRADPAPGLAAQIVVYAIALDRVPILASPDLARTLPELAAISGPTLACTTREQLRIRGRRAVLVLECEPLDAADLRSAWTDALPRFAEHAAALAARFPIEPTLLREIATDLDTQAQIDRRPSGPAELLEAIRLRVGTGLRSGIRLQRPSAGWDRLILPSERLAALHEALARVRHQAQVIDDWGFLCDRPGARGVRMMFCGPPGTGKTLAAEVLAHELGTDLLVVDLSRLVSKWIGETEKNLAEVFAAAERSRAVLLFDEADALFGKRTEISDAHDRHANLETAYLLTRLEQYQGLTVLATNLRRNIDAAFVRRLEFIVEFELPNHTERRELWRVHLPPAAPLAADVDLRELADFYALAGGLIRNAAVAAAFLAAESGGPITRAQLLRSIRREYEKTGAAFPGTPPTRGRT